MSSILFRKLMVIVGALCTLLLLALIAIPLTYDYLNERDRKKRQIAPAARARWPKLADTEQPEYIPPAGSSDNGIVQPTIKPDDDEQHSNLS